MGNGSGPAQGNKAGATGPFPVPLSNFPYPTTLNSTSTHPTLLSR